jgi:tetratricopeptide (TPR) repeat protein
MTNRYQHYRWDVFISHASEDKEPFVRSLATALEDHGLRVWYDDRILRVGDRLRPSIEAGLASARYGIVVLSPNFFSKQWPQDELDGLATRERDGTKVILPVWHEIDQSEVARFAPMLAGRMAARSSEGLAQVVKSLTQAMPDCSVIQAQQSTATDVIRTKKNLFLRPSTIVGALLIVVTALILIVAAFSPTRQREALKTQFRSAVAQRDLKQAESLWTELDKLRLPPETLPNLERGEMCLLRDQPDEAIRHLRLAVTTDRSWRTLALLSRALISAFHTPFGPADTGEAERLAREALAKLGNTTNNADLAYAQQTLGMVLVTNGDPKGAEPFLRSAFDICSSGTNIDLEQLASTADSLATAYENAGDASSADALYGKATRLFEKAQPAGSIYQAVTMASHAKTLKILGRIPEAEKLYSEALGMGLRACGCVEDMSKDCDNVRVAGIQVAYAILLSAEARADEALRFARAANRVYAVNLHANHYQRANSEAAIAQILNEANRDPDEALALARSSLEKFKALYVGDHPRIAMAMSSVGAIMANRHARENREEPAEVRIEVDKMYIDAYDMLRRFYGNMPHRDISLVLQHRGVRISKQGQLAKDLEMAKQGVELIRSAKDMNLRLSKGQPTLDLAMSLYLLALAEARTNEWGPAAQVSLDAANMYRNVLQRESRDEALCWSVRANSLRQLVRLEEALKIATQAVEIAHRTTPKGDPVQRACQDVLDKIMKAIADQKSTGTPSEGP